MSTQTKTLEELIKELPQSSRNEVRDFVEFLISRQHSTSQVDASDKQERLEQLFGTWDSGDNNSADNERIEADLAHEYADEHEARS